MNKKEDLKKAAQEVAARLKEMFGEGTEFICSTTYRSNEELTAIGMRVLNGTTLPTMYMENMPEGASVEEMSNIAAAYFQEFLRDVQPDELPDFPEFSRENVLDNVVLQVLSRKRNRQLLREHPHIEFLDLAGVFRIPISYARNSLQSVLIFNHLPESLNLSMEELEAAARRNTIEKFGCQLVSHLLTKQYYLEQKKSYTPPPFEDVKMDQPCMYTLTNMIEINGATLILFPHILEQLGEKAGMDYFLLPSSIHELMVAKDDGTRTAKSLRSTVYQANRTPAVIKPVDILSDNVYHYDRKKKTLKIV